MACRLTLFALFATAWPVLAQEKRLTAAEAQTAGSLKGAQSDYRRGSFEQALAGFNEALRIDPRSAAASAGAARCYLRLGKVSEAASVLESGMQSNPSDSDLKVVQGELLFRKGRIPEAERLFVDVINSGVPNANAYADLARLSGAIAMNRRAYRLTKRAHELDPDNPDVQKLWIATLSREERIKSLEAYLAQPAVDDAETRHGLEVELGLLKARQKRGGGACHLVSDVSATETDLLPLLVDPLHLRGLGLPVVLNGQKSSFLLDTGAGGIAINRKLAARVGILKVIDSTIRGVGDKGDVPAEIGFAESVRIGNLEFRDCPVQVVDRRALVEEDGLIGADVFAGFLIEIDFPKRKLKLAPLPTPPGESRQKPRLSSDDAAAALAAGNDPSAGGGPPESRFRDRYIPAEMQSYVRLYRFGHMLLVPTKMNDVPGKLFLLDSGAFNNTISPDAAREVTKVHGDSTMEVRGVSGRVKDVYETGKVVLEFGSLRQEQRDMVAFDLSTISRDIGTEVSGTFGFAMLNLLRVKIDYRDALAEFDYK